MPSGAGVAAFDSEALSALSALSTLELLLELLAATEADEAGEALDALGSSLMGDSSLGDSAGKSSRSLEFETERVTSKVGLPPDFRLLPVVTLAEDPMARFEFS